MLVNYKRIDDPSQIPLDSILDDLFVNTTACFGAEKDEDVQDYAERLVNYLHNDLVPVDEDSASSMRSTSSRKKSIFFYNQEYTYRKPVKSDRYELFVLFDEKQVVASCIVQFDDIYKSCEIHEVCVGKSGKGYCKALMTAVRNHLAAGYSEYIREIRIFCEKNNPAACKCYATVFPTAIRVEGHHTTAFIYT